MTLRTALMIGAGLASLTGAAHAAEDCAKLTRLKIPHVTITSAEIVAAGAVVTAGGGELGAAPVEYCRVQAVSRPTADSDIRLEVWVPSGKSWNGKFEQVGNGGFAGSLPYRLMSYILSRGYAVAGTDDGHQSTEATDASWALDHPEKITDYGWRAIRETSITARQVLFKLTAKKAAKSYFYGCSDGGREALMMAQRFPDYFDGIVAGAPAYAMTRLLTSGAVLGKRLGDEAGHLSPAKLALLQSHSLQSCGGGSHYLSDPIHCKIDLAPLRCTAAETDSCLTDAQIETARQIYAGNTDPVSGAPLYGVLPGAEAVKGSWETWLTGGEKIPAGKAFTWNYFAYMVRNDPHLDPATLTESDLARGVQLYRPIMDSDSPDLTAFKAHGGKLIQYHGLNDPGIPPGYSLEYQEKLAAKMGDTDGFYRLYMVPGMLHCLGGDAPTRVDWQTAIEGWVEQGKAPGDLTAAGENGATQTVKPHAAP